MTPTTITREEIEQATDELLKTGIYDMGAETNGTLLLSEMIKAARQVHIETAIRAAYHHGIRIGMEIAAARAKQPV